jgi:hypothetical protein
LLLISYSNTLYELHHFAAQPTVFAAKQRNSKPSFFHATTAASACTQLIAAHLCRRRQRFTPNVSKSSSGAHVWPSHAKVDTPRCSAISTSYYRLPRPASCTPSRCHRRRHRHCLCRARWRIDRPPHRAHPRRRTGDHCIPYVR